MENIKLAVDYGALGILLFMSILVVGYALERWFFFRAINVKQYASKNKLERDLSKNLTLISLIGSNAPYVGLLGTVGGIMVVFYDIGMSGGALDTSKVIVGLALALKVTAAGLIVAIPSTMIYGAFLRKLDVAMSEWEDEVA
ncbi:TonB-system energizer ExbB [Sulfurospirillum sp. MES]|uniref:TonB-system energizer ExbB n=1 Tax=Sulfurospirillum sp. MES TaxID=1565314 RepID=UPI00054402B6|nr:TonB-system energizer ExbB [Sulfurospirillum sp. MES]KHG33994.1 MAG: biopolymer transporter ExbB [Sulfurospirillum sp. MES]